MEVTLVDQVNMMEERKKATEQGCLVHHVANLPVPAAIFNQATSYYNWAKQYQLANLALSMAEGAVKMAYDSSKPVLSVLDKPVSVASKMAVDKLDSLEQSYPTLTMTPEEILEEARRYVDSTRPVKAIRSVKEYKDKKVENTKQLCQSVVSTGQNKLNGVFDLSERLIDQYVVPEGKGLEVQVTLNASVSERAGAVYGKLSYGLKERAQTSYEVALSALAQLRATRLVLDNLNQMMSTGYQYGKGDLGPKVRTALDQVKATATMPFTIDFLRVLTGRSEQFVNQLVQLIKPWMSERFFKPLETATGYVHTVNQRVHEAENLTDLKTEVLIQAREKFAEVEDVVMRVAAALPSRFNHGRSSEDDVQISPVRSESMSSEQSNSSLESP